MSVTCLLSPTYNDVRCPVCGEGFIILARADSADSRRHMRREVGEVLRAHHAAHGATHVHTTEPFTVTVDNCSPLPWLSPSLTFPALPSAAMA